MKYWVSRWKNEKFGAGGFSFCSGRTRVNTSSFMKTGCNIRNPSRSFKPVCMCTDLTLQKVKLLYSDTSLSHWPLRRTVSQVFLMVIMVCGGGCVTREATRPGSQLALHCRRGSVVLWPAAAWLSSLLLHPGCLLSPPKALLRKQPCFLYLDSAPLHEAII